MRSLLVTTFALGACLLGFAADTPARPPLVVTANTILDDLVRQVGGDQVTTYCLVAPGDDPHAFEPRPSDVKQLVRADLLVVNGLNLEPAVIKLAVGSGFHGDTVVATAGLTPRTGDHDHTRDAPVENRPTNPQSAFRNPQSSAPDPHAWQNPLLVATYVANIRDALARANPASAPLYASRAATYTEQLTELDRWAREQIATIPPARRKLVSSHDSLGYFADTYGFETVPVAGLSSSVEPDARAVAGIIDLIRREQVPAVFFELTTNPKLLRQIGADAGVRLAEPLFTDSVGAPGSGAETYLGLVRTNVTRIVSALQ
jgi:zinc/manganese transport system substrate-binding protein